MMEKLEPLIQNFTPNDPTVAGWKADEARKAASDIRGAEIESRAAMLIELRQLNRGVKISTTSAGTVVSTGTASNNDRGLRPSD